MKGQHATLRQCVFTLVAFCQQAKLPPRKFITGCVRKALQRQRRDRKEGK